jgi:putative DNA primase/helicase
MPGGRKKGCYHSIGKPAGVLIVCEGFATGASSHEATGDAVAVAFDAGNLEPVAVALRVKYPSLKIIIAADDDHLTDGNPGMTKARAAALAVGGLLAVPSFPAGRPDKATDFNDLHQLAGADAVRACMDAAQLCAAAEADDWPEPTPLPNALPPVDPFDAELLPVALRGWVMDITHRMQCPADFPAVAALVALSSLIGARAVIQPKARDDWQVVPNLWGAVVGRPGVKKSPALGEALKPLHRLQANEFELWQAAHDAWALDCKVMAMQDDANERKAKGLAGKDPAAARALLEPVDTPAEPTARRFIVNDATVEKLGELMQQNPWGTLSYRDELYGLLTGLDKQGQEGARAFMLQSYDGNQGYTFDRIGRGTVHIPRVCLAMIGGIQPGRIQEYVRGAVAGGSADDGLLQRFGLTVWPDTTGEFMHVDQWPDTPAKQTAWAVFERLAELQPASDTEPTVWRFDDAAQALFVEWLVPFETEIRGDDLHPAMVSHLSKYRKLIPALALVFALIDTPDSGGVIHEGELLRALAWGDYLRSHANRLYAAAVMPETTDAVTLLSRIRAGRLVDKDGVILDSFTPRQIAIKGWAGLATPDAVRKAADALADYDWLRRDVVQSGDALGRGRPSDRYAVNPLARGAA